MTDLSSLSKKFASIPGLIFKETVGGLGMVEITTSAGDATIALQGAQVTTWTPKDQAPVIWLSSQSKFILGKSVRGGVPICWPWFGPHATQSSFPGHGFARTVPWEVVSIEELERGDIRLQFRLCHDANTLVQWPHKTPVTCQITVGSRLEIEVTTRNEEDTPVHISEALHTYLAVSDVRKVQVTGLENVEYIDKVNGGKRLRQSGVVTISNEVDRVYLNTNSECFVDDAGWQRRIRIKKEGSQSTIVWNPGQEKADKMGDLGKDGYLGMLCVESGNALENSVEIAPGAEHRLWVSYETQVL